MEDPGVGVRLDVPRADDHAARVHYLGLGPYGLLVLAHVGDVFTDNGDVAAEQLARVDVRDGTAPDEEIGRTLPANGLQEAFTLFGSYRYTS